MAGTGGRTAGADACIRAVHSEHRRLRLAYTAIIDGSATYMTFSTPVIEAPKPWIELVSPQPNELGGLLDGIVCCDPTALSQPLLTCKDVRLVGNPEVGGIRTSEYSARLATSAALAAIPTAQQPVLAQGRLRSEATSNT